MYWLEFKLQIFLVDLYEEYIPAKMQVLNVEVQVYLRCIWKQFGEFKLIRRRSGRTLLWINKDKITANRNSSLDWGSFVQYFVLLFFFKMLNDWIQNKQKNISISLNQRVANINWLFTPRLGDFIYFHLWKSRRAMNLSEQGGWEEQGRPWQLDVSSFHNQGQCGASDSLYMNSLPRHTDR